MKKNSSLTFLLSIIVALVASCTSSRPSYVLNSSDMEDVLYDVHRAHFIQEESSNGQRDGAMQYALFLHVLKQHKVSQAKWDSSLVYYTRHADELEDIYNNLTERLDYEASVMGAGVSEGADSTDIWKADRHILLTSDDINASYQWKLNVDTLLVSGERVKLRFLALFLNQNTERRATALITLRLKNDSVVVRQQVVTQSAIYNIEVMDDANIGIKSIEGLFMLHKINQQFMSNNSDDEDEDKGVANQIFAISDIKLLHEDAQKERRDAERRDSLNAIHGDSIRPTQRNLPPPDDKPLDAGNHP